MDRDIDLQLAEDGSCQKLVFRARCSRVREVYQLCWIARGLTADANKVKIIDSEVVPVIRDGRMKQPSVVLGTRHHVTVGVIGAPDERSCLNKAKNVRWQMWYNIAIVVRSIRSSDNTIVIGGQSLIADTRITECVHDRNDTH